mmetsp:Transcript_52877/g.114830  ORF Transcript_52877/g.114830 Transcript_52877/m.114830 type:complete len:204 (+) Transcript_52877:778-1389(+)
MESRVEERANVESRSCPTTLVGCGARGGASGTGRVGSSSANVNVAYTITPPITTKIAYDRNVARKPKSCCTAVPTTGPIAYPSDRDMSDKENTAPNMPKCLRSMRWMRVEPFRAHRFSTISAKTGLVQPSTNPMLKPTPIRARIMPQSWPSSGNASVGSTPVSSQPACHPASVAPANITPPNATSFQRGIFAPRKPATGAEMA